MRRPAAVALAVFSLASACNIDAALEAPEVIQIRLSMAVTTTALNMSPGSTATVDATITRLGEYTGDVGFSFTGVPEGVTTSVGALQTTGKVTSATLTFNATPNAAVGTHFVTIRGNAGSETKITQQVTLVITAIPAVGILPATQSVVIIRGGIAPVGVLLNRTNFTGPVTVSLAGVSGITASVSGGAVSGNTGTITISVASTVAPGTHQVTLRSSAPGISESTSTMSVIVSPDPLQLIADHAATAQASVVTTPVIVNRFGVSGAVTITGEGLPAGVSVSFPGGPASGTTASARFAVGASTPPAAYTVTLRARSAGFPDATTTLVLTVGPSNVAMSLAPQNVTMLQGTSAASTVQIVRTSFSGAVSIEIVAAPAGIAVQPSEPTFTGASTTLLVQAARSLAPGAYPVSIRVVPAPSEIDGPALDPVMATLTVTVVEAPSVNANVLLDWSACGAPGWVAAQDGTGPWTRLTGVGGRFGFALTSVRGGFAYEDGAGIAVRYMTSAELTAGAINLCPPPVAATHNVSGIAQHVGANDAATWRLGGGSGISTSATPAFTMTGVRDGTHDLIGWGTSQTQTRMFIARDINEPAGGSVGTVGLVSSNAFTPSISQFTLSGFLAGERMNLSVNYLTTAACTENLIWETASPTLANGAIINVFGVPALQQRPTDFHYVTLTGTGTNEIRSTTISFGATQPSRTLSLPGTTAITMSNVAGSHLRLRATLSNLPVTYNTRMSIRFTSGDRTANVSASAGTFASGVVVLDFPELGGVSGFNSSMLPPAGSHGTFGVTLEGSSGGSSLCSEGAARRTLTRTGPF